MTFTICKGQIMTEEFKESDIQEIILNCKEHKVFNFHIAGKLIFDNQKFVRGHIFYYSIEEDSLLTHIYKNQKYKFVIRDKQFIYLENKEEKNLRPKNEYLIEYDSARTNFTKLFRINNNDTIISFCFKETKDTLNRIIESIFWNYLDTKNCKKHLFSYNSDTTTETCYNYELGKWSFESETQIIEKERKEASSKKNQIFTKGNIKKTSINPKENYMRNYEKIRTITYDKNHIIKDITTVEKVYDLSNINPSSWKTKSRLKLKQESK